MSAVIVPFRPRSEVPRAIRVIRTPEPATLSERPTPVTVGADVMLSDLHAALHAGGLSLDYDQRTGCMIVRKARRD